MKVEIWSDVVCPWCYIGKRHFEAAVAEFGDRDELTCVWRSFQLDPSAPAQTEGDPVDRLATKYGMSRADAEAAQARVTAAAADAGLEFHLERARSGNTLDAHRLLHHAATVQKQDVLKERFMAAYFTEGAAIADHAVLVGLAGEVGVDVAAAQAVLDGDEFATEVRNDIRHAQELGIRGVPYFVIDSRFGISGAQPAELLLQALRKAHASAPLIETVAPVAAEGACEDDNWVAQPPRKM